MLEIDAYVEEAYSTLHHDESVLLALPTPHRAGRPREPPALPTCSLESTCLHSMRAHRVEQLARTALQACNMLVGEEHLLASDALLSRSSLGPLPPSCRSRPRSWPRRRCHSSTNYAHFQQQATAHRLACSAPSAAEMDKSCARGRASVATIHGGCSANCEFCCASKLLAPPFQIGGRFGAIPWMQKNFASCRKSPEFGRSSGTGRTVVSRHRPWSVS